MRKFKGIKLVLSTAVFMAAFAVNAYAGRWAQDSTGWWYDWGNGSWPSSSWQWIDGNSDGVAECYYFDRFGYCMVNTTTPDNYQVNASGAWVENGVVQTRNVGVQKSSNSIKTSNSTIQKSSETKKKEEENKDKKDENKAPEGFVAKKLEDYFKDDQKTKNPGLYNLDITGSYLNPITGVTADGGTKNAAIGEGMVQGVISPINAGGDLNEALKNQKSNGEKRWSKAMLQRTKDGKLYATVRVHLMNWVQRSKEQGPFIKVLQKDGEFKQVAATETKVNIEQYKDSYVDYRFEVPNENFLAMVQMYVEPMNRPVRYFVEVNTDTIKNGNEGLDMEVIKETNYVPYYVGGGIGVLVIAAGAFFALKKRKNN